MGNIKVTPFIIPCVLLFLFGSFLETSSTEAPVPLVRGSSSWWKWVETDTPVYLNVYVYNVTNPDQVEAGQRPRLQEVGPYVYQQRIQKIDPHSVNCKETVKYEQKVTYFFNQEKSKNHRETDVVNIYNVPFISVIAGVARRVGNSTAGAVANYALSNETLVRRNVLVGDLTFNGFDVSNYDTALLNPLPEEFSGFRYGLYKGKNESTDGQYEIFSGVTTLNELGKIRKWRGDDTLPFWNSEECNHLEGTDGSIFPPSISNSSLTIFSSDWYRKLNLTFREEVTVKNISGYRFNLPKEALANPVENPWNLCYCLKPNFRDCKSGLVDGSVGGGAPIVFSQPHFLDGDEDLAAVVGLLPNRVLHETIVDVEPKTGTLLGSRKRMQINVEVNPLGTVNAYRYITESMILPVIWVDEERVICDIDAREMQ